MWYWRWIRTEQKKILHLDHDTNHWGSCGEAIEAFRHAHSVPGCLVYLGDRPYKITLKRLSRYVPVSEVLKFTFIELIGRIFQIMVPKEKTEITQKEAETMNKKIARNCPEYFRVVVQERDIYLTHSIKLAANIHFGHQSAVVAVVGMAHVPGIIEHWDTIMPQDPAQFLDVS